MAIKCWLNNVVVREADLRVVGCWLWVLLNNVVFSFNVIFG